MARIAVEALHGVGVDQIKERLVCLLRLSENLRLPRKRQLGERFAELCAAFGVDRREPLPVSALIRLEVPGQLKIDVVDHAGLAGSGVAILRDDLFAHRLDGRRFLRREEPPSAATLAAAGNH